MLKKTIKHNDVDGNPTETDAYFNLTKAEAIELNIRNDLEVIGRGRNNNEIMDAFKRILQMAYGVRTGDGRFIKVNDQGTPLFYEFSTTEAYSELFMELFQNPDYAQEFIRGILPAEISGNMNNQTDIPAHLANHPSMQGHKAAQQPATRREARDIPGQTSMREGETAESMEARIRRDAAAVEVETPAQMEARIRQELLVEMQRQNQDAHTPETPSAPVSLTPTEADQPNTGFPPRDQLI